MGTRAAAGLPATRTESQEPPERVSTAFVGVVPLMVAGCRQFKVFGSVVGLDAVPVVNDFVRGERPADQPHHHEDVLVGILEPLQPRWSPRVRMSRRDTNGNVTVRRQPALRRIPASVLRPGGVLTVSAAHVLTCGRRTVLLDLLPFEKPLLASLGLLVITRHEETP